MGKTNYSNIKYLPNLAVCYMLQQLPRKGPGKVGKIISKRNRSIPIREFFTHKTSRMNLMNM